MVISRPRAIIRLTSGWNPGEMGRGVIEALGIRTAATHMEWFFGPKGLECSEIGCRPPGVGHWDVYCAANIEADASVS
jgi:hypothetical protein